VRRGGVLSTALLFLVLVTVSAVAVLSISHASRFRSGQDSVDVRLMIAAEGAIETVRGRLSLERGIQDDWLWISNATWTRLGSIRVNGIDVEVEALRDRRESVPMCRVRARATDSGVTRVVEITVKVASFSDYAVWVGGPSTLGQDYKLVGNYYNNGNILARHTGARIYGRTELVGAVSVTAGGETLNTVFPNENPITVPGIPFPTSITEWSYLKQAAGTTGYVFAENTIEIILSGTTFTRWYVRRAATATEGVGNVPTGQVNGVATWIDPATGTVNYLNSTDSNPFLVTADYEFVSETLAIPEDGVIYVQSGAASGISAGPLTGKPWNNDNLAFLSGTNGFTQQHTLNDFGAPGDVNYDERAIFRNYETAFEDVYPSGSTPVLLLSGTLKDRRVTIASDHRIIIKQPIAYQGNLDNPDNRRFFNDGGTGKQGAAATSMTEMLGVLSRSEIHPTPTWWIPMPSNSWVTGDIAGETLPGHDFTDIKSPNADYFMDGVYLAIGRTAPTRNYDFPVGAAPLGELWLCGGLICQGSHGGGNGNTFCRRNYDWDYRLSLTMPPYFLRAYKTPAHFVPGSWRTWKG
jgi:hypothetical protein